MSPNKLFSQKTDISDISDKSMMMFLPAVFFFANIGIYGVLLRGALKDIWPWS